MEYFKFASICLVINLIGLISTPAQTNSTPTGSVHRAEFFLTHQFTLKPLAQSEMLELLKQPNVYLIDARPHEIYAQGHLPQALNLTLDHFAQDYSQNARLWHNQQPAFIVYCASSTCHLAEGVALRLFDEQQTQLYLYTGGWADWSKTHPP